MRCEEAQQLITPLVDNELSHDERYCVEVHLNDCQRCMFIYRQERQLKRAIRLAGASLKAPADLKEKILPDCGVFAESGNLAGIWKSLFWPLKTNLRVAFVGATVLLMLVPLLYVTWSTNKPVALAALEIHEKIVRGAISLERSGSPQETEQLLFRSAPMEYDSSMVGLRAAGASVQHVRGRKILVTVYEGQGPSVTCYTFLGAEEDAPANAAIFFDPEKGKTFYSFSQDRINGVIQRVGEEICILVSEMPAQDLLALARSKY